jgi:hypothetical protein
MGGALVTEYAVPQRIYIVPSAKLVIAGTGATDMLCDNAPLPNVALARMKAAD